MQSKRKVNEEMLGGLGYTEFFLPAQNRLEKKKSYAALQWEKSEHRLGKIERNLITNVSILLVTRVSACVGEGNGRKLPSAQQAAIWSSFHQLRASPEIKDA